MPDINVRGGSDKTWICVIGTKKKTKKNPKAQNACTIHLGASGFFKNGNATLSFFLTMPHFPNKSSLVVNCVYLVTEFFSFQQAARKQ